MNVEIEAVTIVKIVVGAFSGGGGFAFLKPFAQHAFDHWLRGREAREAAEREREARVLVALEKSVRAQEGSVRVLESIDERMGYVLARQEALMAHHGLTLSPSKVPEPGAAPDPRASISGS
ncbi:MAG TPA: hypothetical protein VLT47_11020 [Anaeromyxobacteraceae bacterium]|nr:hypothetical protein [Anaeromyxobacteraceae bacterium]